MVPFRVKGLGLVGILQSLAVSSKHGHSWLQQTKKTAAITPNSRLEISNPNGDVAAGLHFEQVPTAYVIFSEYFQD